MNKTEFLDLLRYYFRNAKKSEVEEILADYEDLEHADILAVLAYAARLSHVNRMELLVA